MAIDSTLAVRNALLSILKADAGVTALVPKTSIFTQWTIAVPAYPFIRSGSPTAVPRRASCLDGADITVAMHAFSSGRIANGVLVEPAEDHAGRIGAAMAGALDGQVVTIAAGKLRVRWAGAQLLIDPEESSVFHTVQNFMVRAITA